MTGDDEVQEIKNTRRILAVSLEDATQHLSKLVGDLTGSPPEAASTTLAGSSHDLHLKTAYYTAVVPIWIDLIASPAEWTASFLSPEAKEVLDVLGGLVLVFPLAASAHPSAARTKEVIREVGRVVKEGLGGWEWDGVSLAVGVGEGTGTSIEEWDDLCADAGLEFVQMTGSAKDEGLNEYDEKMGVARVREALEANDWANSSSPLSDFGDFEEGSEGLGGEGDESFDPENLDFGFDKADFEGMRMDILHAGLGGGGDPAEEDRAATELAGSSDAKTTTTTTKEEKDGEHKDGGEDEEGAGLNDDDVLKVERMMRKLQAVREAGEGMGQEQRKRMAARAVEEVMREL